MTNWEDVTAIQRPTANTGDTTYERDHFLCGSYGERYYDMAYDGTDYWLCKKSYAYDLQVEVTVDGEKIKKYITPSETSLWTMYWERASQYNFLMARTFFAAKAYIESLAVKKLYTSSVGAGSVSIADGLINMEGTNGTKITFGTDENGNAVLQFYSGATLLYDLGPSGITKHVSQDDNTWGQRNLISINIEQFSSFVLRTGNGVPYYLFTEGYSEVGNVRTYNISQASTPSAYDGITYKNANDLETYLRETSNYIPDGWYREENLNGIYKAVAGSSRAIDGSQEQTVYNMLVYRYQNGLVTMTKIIEFTKDEENNLGYRV